MIGEGGRVMILTNTTRGHVSGHHNGALVGLELVKDPITLVLLLVAVNREGGPSVLAKESGNIVSDTLGANKYENLVLLVLHNLFEVLDHLVTLLHIGADFDNLSNSVVGSKVHGTNVDLNEVVKEVGSHGADLLGPGGGPHQSLTVGANLLKNLANLGLETHVEHAISLVENKIGDTAQVGLASLNHVNETTRSGDADLDTARKVTNLRALGDTTVNAGVADTGRAAELGDFLLNLNSKFSGRSENKNDRTITRGKERLGVDVDDGGQTVSKCLAGTSLGNTDDIATGKSHGPTLGLNGRGGREALRLDLVHNVAGEASLVKGLDGSGNVATSNGHLVLCAESIDIGLRAVLNLAVDLVEILLELGHSRNI